MPDYLNKPKDIADKPYQTQGDIVQGLIDKGREFFGGKSAEAAALDRKMEQYGKPKPKPDTVFGGVDRYKD